MPRTCTEKKWRQFFVCEQTFFLLTIIIISIMVLTLSETFLNIAADCRAIRKRTGNVSHCFLSCLRCVQSCFVCFASVASCRHCPQKAWFWSTYSAFRKALNNLFRHWDSDSWVVCNFLRNILNDNPWIIVWESAMLYCMSVGCPRLKQSILHNISASAKRPKKEKDLQRVLKRVYKRRSSGQD